MTTTLTEPAAGRAPQADGTPRSVLIADDHPLFRRGIARLVDRQEDLVLVGEAADGREALELIAALEPDVAVLDHRMPGLTGAEVCAQLARRPERPRTAVLLLSAFEDVEIVAAAVDAGAAGYVGKGADQQEILDAIHRVGSGRVAFMGRAAAGVDEAFRRRLEGPAAR